MNFIKRVFDEDVDENVHQQFQKFSKGEFRNRAVIHAKKSKNKYTIITTSEFTNGLVRIFAEKLGDERTNVKGAIVSTNDLTGEIDFQDKKQFQGVKRYLIDKEMSGTEILGLLDKFPKTFFALSFSVGDDILKVKPKAPKSGKPGSKGGAPKPDFCRLKTTDEQLGSSFVFERPDFKKAEINHTFFIEGMVISDELKASNDFSKIREECKRKGRIVRKAIIDEQEVISEKEFAA